MSTLSLCMIVKDEEDVLARVLTSAHAAVDEIIIVDTGSKDETKQIAAKFTDKIYDFVWQNDFSAARNYSFAQATCDYIIWLDADDVLPRQSSDDLIALKATLGELDVVMLPYHTAFDEGGKATYSYYRERILKRAAGFKWTDPVHEVIVPAGKIGYAEIPVQHRKLKKGNPLRNLLIYEELVYKGAALSERQRFYFAGELYYSGNSDLALSAYESFLKGKGASANKIQACLNMSRIQRRKNDDTAALSILFNSFLYETPSAEILCEVGNIYLGQKKYEQARFWYETALGRPVPKGMAFVETDCYGYIPNIQLSLCHYYLGNLSEAVRYNDEALKLKPYDKSANQNKRFYDSL